MPTLGFLYSEVSFHFFIMDTFCRLIAFFRLVDLEFTLPLVIMPPSEVRVVRTFPFDTDLSDRPDLLFRFEGDRLDLRD